MKNWRKIGTWSAERISQRVLYLLIGIALLVFSLFWLVGFDRPFIDNPDFNDPLFTNVLIALMWLLLVAAMGVAVWSVVSALKKRGKTQQTVNNIPVKRLAYSVALGTVALLGLTFLLGSGKAMTVNGVPFADRWWLKVSDMFIWTSLSMILVAVGAVVYGATKYNRRSK